MKSNNEMPLIILFFRTELKMEFFYDEVSSLMRERNL